LRQSTGLPLRLTLPSATAPPGVKRNNVFGVATDPDVGRLSQWVSSDSSRCLYKGYRFESPLAGMVDSQNQITVNSQPGANFGGMYYTLHRHYDPVFMRFTSPDPLAAPFYNLYHYAGNNPAAFFDPDGLHPQDGPYLWDGGNRGTMLPHGPSGSTQQRLYTATDNPVSNFSETRTGRILGGATIAAWSAISFFGIATWELFQGRTDTIDETAEQIAERMIARKEAGAYTYEERKRLAIMDGVGLTPGYEAVTGRDSVDRRELTTAEIDERIGQTLFMAGALTTGVRGLRGPSGGRVASINNRVGPRGGQAVSRPTTWNEFQRTTRGQFSSRAQAGKAWAAYKKAHGITTGAPRNSAVRVKYIRSLADHWTTPSWMKPWLKKGKVPPGYVVHHVKPLSVGGLDAATNMRLQAIDLHKMHHRFHRPWE
jgi:RHS repeat-associated protein